MKPDKASERTGAIWIPPDRQARDQKAQVKGMLISAGGNAFEYWPENERPKPGDRILFAKYSGIEIYEPPADPKDDQIEYRIINDEDVAAVLTD